MALLFISSFLGAQNHLFMQMEFDSTVTREFAVEVMDSFPCIKETVVNHRVLIMVWEIDHCEETLLGLHIVSEEIAQRVGIHIREVKIIPIIRRRENDIH